MQYYGHVKYKIGSVFDDLFNLGKDTGSTSEAPNAESLSIFNSLPLIGTITGFLGGLIKAFGWGDQVPGLPIKSKATYQGILDNIKQNFPDPASIADAQRLYDKAIEWQRMAYDKVAADKRAGKDGTVNESYAIMYGKTAQVYKNYISYGGNPPGSGYTLPATTTTQKQAGLTWIAIAIGGAILLGGMGKPRRSRPRTYTRKR